MLCIVETEKQDILIHLCSKGKNFECDFFCTLFLACFRKKEIIFFIHKTFSNCIESANAVKSLEFMNAISHLFFSPALAGDQYLEKILNN